MVRMPNKAETPARVQDLERRVRELFASADQSARTAQSSANTAQSTATTAQSTATTAQNTASTAQSTAQTAQTTATTANTAAQTAQSAAQQASTDAANANTNASTAQQQAQAAQQAAAAKTKTTWSTAVPDNTQNPGTTDGDVWYVTNGTGGNATAQYRWSASNSQWLLTPIDGTALRNVIADTVKAGAIDGQTITGGIFKTAASGTRVELGNTSLKVYNSTSTIPVGYILATPQGGSGDSYGTFRLTTNSDGGNSGASLIVGSQYVDAAKTLSYGVGVSSFTYCYFPFTYFQTLFDTSGRTVLSGRSTYFDISRAQRFRVLSSSADTTGYEIASADSTTGLVTVQANDTLRAPKLQLTSPTAGGGTNVLSIIASLRSNAAGTSYQQIRLYAENAGDPTKYVAIQAGDFLKDDGTSLIPTDSGWLSPSVATGSGYSVNTLRYRKVGNRVEWTGQLNRSSNMASQTNVITVPAAYAPSVPSGGTTRIFSATGTAGTAFRFNFNTNGTIDIRDIANGTTTYAILDGITYLTD